MSYHSKLSKRPYIYTFNSDLSATNIMLIVKNIMEYNYTLLSMSLIKKSNIIYQYIILP